MECSSLLQTRQAARTKRLSVERVLNVMVQDQDPRLTSVRHGLALPQMVLTWFLCSHFTRPGEILTKGFDIFLDFGQKLALIAVIGEVSR